MTTDSRQHWKPGADVRVGFMHLTVLTVIATPGNPEPDAFLLINESGQRYLFVPQRGIHRYNGVVAPAHLRTCLA